MKLWGYFCLAAFGLTFLGSLLTYAFGRQPPEYGDVATAAIMILAFVGTVAVLLSKFVGFGNAAIPKEKRGLRAAFRVLSTPFLIALIICLGYTIAIAATSKYKSVRKQIGTYYLEVAVEPGETATHVMVSKGANQTKRVQVSAEEAYAYLWQWNRVFMAILATIDIACAAFFLSRAARQDPELKKQIDAGLFSAQVDDSMNL